MHDAVGDFHVWSVSIGAVNAVATVNNIISVSHCSTGRGFVISVFLVAGARDSHHDATEVEGRAAELGEEYLCARPLAG
jgi:hypothetical protein